ncbi:hypothetical protein [Muribaculum intestinale]|uniref:hypothetical protein n=1 Tax=Muribaculum intestinale TaxID=1796646 RepID=UPI003526EB98
MAITQDEMQSIVSAVLSAIRTNSRTIDQLTPVTSLSDNDSFEINGGKRVTYKVLRDLIASLSSTEQDSLKNLIAKSELKSASITATESSATLSISSVGKTITASIPIATTSKAGLMTAADKVKLQSAYDTAQTAKDTANSAQSKAETAQSDVNTLNNKLGTAGGIATLDNYGKIPSRFIPDAYDDVKEFGAKVSGVSITPASVTHNSNDANCMVVYDTDTNTFLLAVANTAIADADWRVVNKKSMLETVSPQIEGVPVAGLTKGDLWQINDKMEVALITRHFTYYNNWADANLFGLASINGRVPVADKQYVDTSANCNYRWSGSTLVSTGSDLTLGHTANTAFPGDEGQQMQEDVESLAGEHDTLRNEFRKLSDHLAGKEMGEVKFIDLNAIVDNSNPYTSLGDALSVVPEEFRQYGAVVRLWIEKEDANGNLVEKWETYQWTRTSFDDGNDWEDETQWEPFGSAGSADGNCLNVTVEIPKTNTTNPYYDLASAVAVVFSKDRAKLGLQITFAATATTWKQYQYIGSTLKVEDFCNEKNWIDMAGTSAGTEPVLNVNNLCGEGALQYGAYTLESAIKAIADKETETGITYRKAGMIITYKVGDGKWESKQLMQTVNSFNVPGAWEPFGSAKGNEIQASDKPVKDGKDAFSTGGAYDRIPTGHKVTQEDGTVTIQLLNEAGDDIMDPIEFLASQGGGGDASGTIVSIAFQRAPLYAALGSTLTTKAAIRSVTTIGSVESDNSIERLELIDKDTKAVVWSANVNKASSPSMTSYTFELDFTKFFTVAGQKTFTLVATDDTGRTGRKNITVVAEDLTLTCTQRLSETITPTDTQAYVEMYAFYNNQSEGGIRCNVDILIDGEWKNIHSDVVNNAFSRPVMFNAVELGLKHGAYKLRMQGESVDSGVKGNIVYSTIMCVDPASDEMLIALRYNDTSNGTIRLFDTVSLDVAAYRKVDGAESPALVDMYIGNVKITQVKIDPDKVLSVRKQISGYSQGDTLVFEGRFGAIHSPCIEIIVDGSALDISLKTGASLNLDFSSRTNDESDHTISDQGITMDVQGANWSTNGFVEFLDQNSLRIAENVKAHLPYTPFGFSTIEQTGAVVQMKIATRNIRDAEARLISCYDPNSGAGFYVCGNKAAIFCKNGINAVEERPLENNVDHTVAFVIEPASVFVERNGIRYSAMKLYIDGEEAAALGYVPGQGNVFCPATMTFDGTDGDLYIYYLLAYRSYYEWAQAFDNYLVKGNDTQAMVEEYNRENVLVSQTAEGTTEQRPSATALWDRKICYMVNVASDEVFTVFDCGNGSDDNGMTTSPKFKDGIQFFYNPNKPWRSYKATNVTKKRQGTTSSQRTFKNEDDDYSKATITPLYPEYATDAELRAGLSAEELADIDTTFKLFALGYIRIGDNTMPIQRAMNKIDFSDSSCANNGGVCDMMNATFRALGSSYMTPAQRFYDGTWDKGDVHLSGIQMNHSIANFPCAIFRSTSETLQNVYFHLRGSYMESKKEQRALGFCDVPGYNKGCLNYGDFKELFCAPGQTLDDYIASADKSTWEYPSDIEDLDSPKHNVVAISEYCGRSFRVFRRTEPGAEWKETTGSMVQINGKWVITGDVVNPVTGFELLNYTGLCWWMGIASVDDMMKMETGTSSWVKKLVDKGLVSNTSYPVWTQFFECMIEDDQLAIDFAMGRKVPYDLFNVLRFMDSCDYSKASLASTWKPRWQTEAWKYMSMESVMTYHIFTDYLAAIDQRAKNMQPMWFLEDGCKIENGVYSGVDGMEPMRMYLNKVYDCDTCNGQDNDGGKTCDPEVDPDKPSDEETGYTNPYAGWGSILFNNIAKCKKDLIRSGRPDDRGVYPNISLMTVAAAMRSTQTTLPDGRTIAPFSPDGAKYYFLEQRINVWPKKVCSYDCERKYIKFTSRANRIYFYAHQGSGRSGIVRFIEVRWLVRDGFYQTGGFFTDPLITRINCRANAKIRITAAARGYFAVGYENVGQISGEAVFLEAGESYEFSEFSKVDGTTLYIYQVARMSMLDLSDLTISSADGIANCKLMEILRIGSATHVNTPLSSYPMVSALTLGSLPFLHTIDVRNTSVTTMDCSGCPRIEHIEAEGSQLTSLTLAQTSPINDVKLPETMTDLRFIGLPGLTYTGTPVNDGLCISALANVQKIRLENSPKIEAVTIIKNIVGAIGSVLRSVRVADQILKGDAMELQKLIAMGVKGMNSSGDENRPGPVVIGTYELTRLLEQSEIDEIEEKIEGIIIFIVIEAFIDAIDQINGEYYTGDSEVPTITLDNIGEHIVYYNGETYAAYIGRLVEDNLSIHEIINQ